MAESRLVASPRPADLDAMHVYNAPILTEREGGVERVGADNVA